MTRPDTAPAWLSNMGCSYRSESSLAQHMVTAIRPRADFEPPWLNLPVKLYAHHPLQVGSPAATAQVCIGMLNHLPSMAGPSANFSMHATRT